MNYIYFLLFAVLIPIVAVNFKARSSFFCFTLFFAIRFLFGFGALTFGIPTACAAAYWSLQRKEASFKIKLLKFLLSVLLPLCAIALFVLHPVGQGAFIYSFYWLIPVFMFFISGSLFATALSSTFIAHAVGTVIWLYTVPSLPEKWIALLPIVALERLLCVMVGVMAVLLFSRLFSILKMYKKNKVISFVRNYL